MGIIDFEYERNIVTLQKSELQATQQLEKDYLNLYQDNDGLLFGLRLGVPSDAQAISDAYVEAFGYEYIDAIVYDVDKLANYISKKNTFWFVGEHLDVSPPEYCGSGVISINDPVTCKMAKVVIREKFQRRGLASEMGIKGIFKIFQFPEFKDILRMNAEARASNIYTQLTMRNQGSKAIGFNPICANLGDRRFINKKEGKPYFKGGTLPVIYYMRTLNNFWETRENIIHLFDNDEIIFFYDYQLKNNRKMKKNDLLITEQDSTKWHFLELQQDYNLGAISLKGYMHDIILSMYLKKFKKWRYIEWRVPTTEKGIHSMKIALESGFKVIGYDMGSFIELDGSLHDTVIFAYFPKKVKLNPDEPLKIVKRVKPMVDKVLETL